jgi:uncharacterized protein YjiS (DUF1127 family)
MINQYFLSIEMFTRVRTVLADFFIMVGRERARNSLLHLNDRLLEDVGLSRELLVEGGSAWPWRKDSVEIASATKKKKITNIFSMASEQEVEIQRAIKELKSYSDRELADIGITRCDIEFVVRNGRPKLDEDPRNKGLRNQHPIAA